MEMKMIATMKTMFAIAGILGSMSAVAQADDMSAQRKMIYEDITKSFGAVPSFVKKLPDASLSGFWQLEKDLDLSTKTALPAKTKALIALAVAAQIPCEYCIWSDTMTAKQLGASDAEIGEAVEMAALTRFSSTTLHGLQVDFGQFKKEMGGQ
jgi:AhpD family alkylhydroperoxidase